MELGGRYSDTLGREGAMQAEVRLACEEDAENQRDRGGTRQGERRGGAGETGGASGARGEAGGVAWPA